MARLSHFPYISKPIVKLLEQKGIFTVLDFLEEDPDKMCSVSGLSFKDVVEIRKIILSKNAVKPFNGFEMYSNLLLKAAKISTGIESLDIILDGGILTGNICEICGLSGEGKTQLCFSVAVYIVLILKQSVYYIDSKYDFSSIRVYNMMKAKNYDDKEIETAMKRIIVVRCEDMFKLTTFLHELENILPENPSRMIILDSLPVLFMPFINEKSNDGLGSISHAASTMKYIATKFQTVFLIVNIAMQTFENIDDNESLTNKQSSMNEITWMGDLRTGMGKAWQHIPSYRLLIQKDNLLLDDTQRVITIVKSIDNHAGQKCVVELTDKGFISSVLK